MLYLGHSIATVAVECHILSDDSKGRYQSLRDKAGLYKVTRYLTAHPSLFIPLDGRNRKLLGLEGSDVAFKGYKPYQEASLELFKRFGKTVHGLTWASFHRNQPGRVFALWHHHKVTVGLQVTSLEPFDALSADASWIAFLKSNPHIEEIS